MTIGLADDQTVCRQTGWPTNISNGLPCVLSGELQQTNMEDPKDVYTIAGMMGQTGDAFGIPWAAKVKIVDQVSCNESE